LPAFSSGAGYRQCYAEKMRDPHACEKDLRSFLRARFLKLPGLTLPTALNVISEFYNDVRDFDVIASEGDGLAAYSDITNHGRGTRLEIGFTRLLRLRSQNDNANNNRYPALRLKLRLCFKWDMDVIKLSEPTWAFDCWCDSGVDKFRAAVERTEAYSVQKDKPPSEVNIVLENSFYRRDKYRLEPDVKQMWWGNVNVA